MLFDLILKYHANRIIKKSVKSSERSGMDARKTTTYNHDEPMNIGQGLKLKLNFQTSNQQSSFVQMNSKKKVVQQTKSKEKETHTHTLSSS